MNPPGSRKFPRASEFADLAKIPLSYEGIAQPRWGLVLHKGGSAALHLWLALSLWSAKHLTDGAVPAHMLATIPGPRGAKVTEKAYQALIAASLLERHADGSVQLVAHHEHHPSRDTVMARRRRWSAAQERHRQSRAITAGVSDDEASSAQLEPGESQRVPSRPAPIPIPTQGWPQRSEALIEAEGCPVVWHTLDGWEEPHGLEDEAVAAGVPREVYRSRLAQLRNTKVGGNGGVRDRTSYIRQQFGRWRTWAEADKAKTRRAPRDRVNQPNCGLTGLEMFDEREGKTGDC